MRRLAAPVTVLALLVLAPGAAAVRHAAPGATGDCVNTPCDFPAAVSTADFGEEVIVAPGNYGSEASPVGGTGNSFPINVHGEAGKPRPKIVAQPSGGTFYALGLFNAGSTAKHLDITAVGTLPSASALGLFGGSAEDMIVHSKISQGYSACYLKNGAVLRSSVCWTPSIQNPPAAVGTDYQGATSTVVTLRNVTAVSLGTGASGVYALTANGASVTVNAVNSVIEGLVAVTLRQADGGGTAKFTPTYSNMVGSRDFAAGGCCTEDASSTNLPGNALFVDLVGNYHQDPMSPTINRGTDGGGNGATDFDGQPRSFGGRTDIGADELVLPPFATTLAAGPINSEGVVLNGRANPRGVKGTEVFFEFGTTTAYTSGAGFETLAPNSKSQEVFASVGGLKPSTRYHYRLVANGPGGRTEAGDKTFVTKPPFMGVVLPADQTVEVPKGTARVKATCPATANGTCTGTLGLSRKGKNGKRVGLGRGPLTIPAGKSQKVPVPLNDAARLRLGDRGSIAARAIATARDESGGHLRITKGNVALERPSPAASR
ncbi:MAG TPA: choice-of-anchor Q domain-containing protein [Thermoleophilaceae bacterium]|nr:choice-of-anchor Q domain-containing protein [Thermoleophilaceae bacterium]